MGDSTKTYLLTDKDIRAIHKDGYYRGMRSGLRQSMIREGSKSFEPKKDYHPNVWDGSPLKKEISNK